MRAAIDRSARTLLGLIDEILDFSKIEADKLEIKTQPFNLDDCMQGVIELMAPKAYEKGIDIAWRIDPALPRRVLGDEVRLRQILTNLVGNAIKFTQDGRRCRARRRAHVIDGSSACNGHCGAGNRGGRYRPGHRTEGHAVAVRRVRAER